MADYFAALRPPPVPQAVVEVSPALLARGRSLVTEGDPAHGVPPCSGCHGPTLTGMEPAIPGLTGLHASYISAPARCLALRHTHRRRTGLHAARRGHPDRKRRNRRPCLARLAADDTARPVTRAKRHAADAAPLRQRTTLRRGRALCGSTGSCPPRILVQKFAASFPSSSRRRSVWKNWLHNRGASFETRPSGAPQDEVCF